MGRGVQRPGFNGTATAHGSCRGHRARSRCCDAGGSRCREHGCRRWHDAQHLPHFDDVGVVQATPARHVAPVLAVVQADAYQRVASLHGVVTRLARVFPAWQLQLRRCSFNGGWWRSRQRLVDRCRCGRCGHRCSRSAPACALPPALGGWWWTHSPPPSPTALLIRRWTNSASRRWGVGATSNVGLHSVR